MKIDRRHVYGIMIDTETCNTLDDPLCYDISWQVIDSHGRLYESRSFAVREVFSGMTELMQSAYYAHKIPEYHEQIQAGEKALETLYTIKQQMRKDVEKYDCKFPKQQDNQLFDDYLEELDIQYMDLEHYFYILHMYLCEHPMPIMLLQSIF